jgi:hypothetical protein
MYFEERQEWFFKKHIDTVQLSDLGRRASKTQKTGLVGVTPFYADAIEEEFIQVTHPKESWFQPKREKKMSITENLYSVKGENSAGISEYTRKLLNLEVNDPDQTFLITTKSKKWGNYFYELFPSFSVQIFGSFEIKDIQVQNPHDVITSIPLYC